jgi:uncharacterized membrane protein YqjE
MKTPDKKIDWPVILGIAVIWAGFRFGSTEIGIVVLVLTLASLGWKMRHKGPF